MIKEHIDEIQIIIKNIYEKIHDVYNDNLEDDGLKLFISSIRCYEVVILEISVKESFEDPELVEQTLLKIKKDLKQILLSIV